MIAWTDGQVSISPHIESWVMTPTVLGPLTRKALLFLTPFHRWVLRDMEGFTPGAWCGDPRQGVRVGQSSPRPQSSGLVGQMPQADLRPQPLSPGRHEVPTLLSTQTAMNTPPCHFHSLPWLSLGLLQEGTSGTSGKLQPMGQSWGFAETPSGIPMAGG